MPYGLSSSDIKTLRLLGLTEEIVSGQLAQLHGPKFDVRIEEACTIRRGVVMLEGALKEDAELGFEALNPDNTVRFIPSSGAASRMFAGLDDSSSKVYKTFLSEAHRLPFFAALPDPLQLLDAVLGEWNWPALPKGAIPFHAGPNGTPAHTAFEDQLSAWAATMPGSELAFSLPDYKANPIWFQALNAAATKCGVPVQFGIQGPHTKTICLDSRGGLFIDADGKPLLRPGGHGALIHNINALEQELVSVVNIDNVLPVSRQEVSTHSRQLLLGLAGHLRQQHDEAVRDLEQGRVEKAQAWLKLGFTHPDEPPYESPAELLAALNRPFRVVGVVRNEGQPGGGPFWMRDEMGRISPQIVEQAEWPSNDPQFEKLLEAATHFNPVDMVLCSGGHNLLDWTDPRRTMRVSKQHDGRPLIGLELPGLWNGAMGAWNTLMVEVPAATFAPVKQLLDLLDSRHQG
jgi:hypothetical protein